MTLPPRTREPELMDAPGLAPPQHRAALMGLARVNRFSRGASMIWPALRDLARTAGDGGPVSILDLATGSGDIPVALDRRLRREGIVPHWTLADLSSVALECASSRARQAGLVFQAIQVNALRDQLPPCDIAVCSTFLHHVDPPDAEFILRSMGRAARRGGVVQDLVRSRFGPLIVGLAARVLTRSPICHADAVISMHAAYTPHELAELAARAGLEGARVQTVWPMRMCLSWRRSC